MVNPHHVAHWYPTAAYLYILGLDMLALAWEYLRRHPEYRLDWLRHHRRPHAAHAATQRWGLRLWEDPARDARDAHPAWLPGHDAVVQLYPDAELRESHTIDVLMGRLRKKIQAQYPQDVITTVRGQGYLFELR